MIRSTMLEPSINFAPSVQLPRKGLKGRGRGDKRRVVDETKKAIMTQHLVSLLLLLGIETRNWEPCFLLLATHSSASRGHIHLTKWSWDRNYSELRHLFVFTSVVDSRCSVHLSSSSLCSYKASSGRSPVWSKNWTSMRWR